MLHGLKIQTIDARQTHALRHAVLRQHQRLEEMVYDGDDLPDTLHLGATLGENQPSRIVGVVTLAPDPMPGQPQPGDWRLRGMAVDHAAQTTGVGRAIVEHAIAELAKRGAKRLWCNARVSALGFYEKFGFATQGEQFEIAPIGPHYVMSVALDPNQR